MIAMLRIITSTEFDSNHTTSVHHTTSSVLQIDTPALRRGLNSTSLAAGFQWRRNSAGGMVSPGREGRQPVMSLCLGRVSVAYPAGLATDVVLYVQRSSPLGSILNNGSFEHSSACMSRNWVMITFLAKNGFITSGIASSGFEPESNQLHAHDLLSH